MSLEFTITLTAKEAEILSKALSFASANLEALEDALDEKISASELSEIREKLLD